MLLRFLLLPFSFLYDFVTRIRNYQFDIGQRKSITFEIPVVSVGNLTVGGTGKTPHVYLIANILRNKHSKQPGILSRGYGRKSKGFVLAEAQSKSAELGDEPLQLYKAFNGEVPVAVCEERILGIPSLLQEVPEVDVIILDDAFQHRKVKPKLNILLSDYNRPFYNDQLLPAGRLREAKKGAARADVVIVTKIPEYIPETEIKQIEKRISDYSEAPVFYSRYKYGNPIHFSGKKRDSMANIILVSGIANSVYLLKYVSSHFNMLQHLEYSDHKRYKEKDLEYILEEVKKIYKRM